MQKIPRCNDATSSQTRLRGASSDLPVDLTSCIRDLMLKMPSRAASRESQYRALTPAPQQAKFSHRRRTARPHRAAGDGAKPLASPNRRQSTLTQLVGGREKDGEVMDVVSGSDEEYQEERPTKGRKTGSLGNERQAPKKVKVKVEVKPEKTESQPTFVEALTSVPAKKARRRRETGLDTQGWQIWQDPSTDDDYSATARMNHTGTRTSLREAEDAKCTDTPSRYDSGHDSRRAFATSPVIPESSQRAALDLDNRPFSPQTANIATPKTVRRLEIPSSRSPASGRWTDSKTERFWASRRSPLRQHSPNLRRTAQDNKTQDLSAVLLDDLFPTDANEEIAAGALFTPVSKPGAKAKDNSEPAAAGKAHAQEPASGKAQKNTAVPAASIAPKFPRTTTIADSQSECLSVIETQSLEFAHLARQEQRGLGATGVGEAVAEQSPQLPAQPPKLQRATTIQDSEYGDSDLDDLEYKPLQINVAEVHEEARKQPVDREAVIKSESALDEGAESDDELTRRSDEDEATYDPAFSALDRDAARFAMLTQTQRIKREPLLTQPHICNDKLEQQTLDLETQVATADVNISDTVAEQLSRDLSATVQGEVEFVPSSQAHERRRAQQIVSGVEEDKAPDTQPTGPIDANGAEERVPSSPPPLRPSQVSTVAPSPTQLSPARPSASAARRIILTSPTSPIPDSIDDDWSPAKDLDTSSSPMPFPPWTQPEDALLGGHGNEGETMGSMSDFSLPPPPPLSSIT